MGGPFPKDFSILSLHYDSSPIMFFATPLCRKRPFTAPMDFIERTRERAVAEFKAQWSN
jgi:hypothetical protein